LTAPALIARARRVIPSVVGAIGSAGRWQDGVTLWLSVAERHPDSPQVCRGLGNALFEAKKEAALDVYRRCAARFGPVLFEKNIAIALYELGRRDEARATFRRIETLRPGDPVVTKYLRLLGPE